MVPQPPEGFTRITDAASSRDGASYNIIGVCVDYLPPIQTTGTCMGMKFNLWDLSCDQSELGQNGMLTRHFFKNNCRFPAIAEAGDVVILMNMKTLNPKGNWLSRSSLDTRWTVIDSQSLMESTSPNFADVRLREPNQPLTPREDNRGSRPSDKEFRYAKALLQQRDPTTLRGPPKTTSLDRGATSKLNGSTYAAVKSTKFRLIKDLVPPSGDLKTFVDIVGELQNIYLTGRPMELKVSDYTENSLLHDYGGVTSNTFRTKHWTYPTGRMTMQINLWDGMAEYVDGLASKGQIQQGMYVRLQNVHIRMDKMGGKLEGHLRGGASHGTAITFIKSDESHKDPAFIDLRKRIRAYKLAQKEDLMAVKRAADESEGELVEQPPIKKSKSAKRREKLRREEKAAKAHAEEQAKEQAHVRPMSNSNVRCEAINVSLTNVASIVDTEQLVQKTEAGNSYRLPFQNCKYKSRVQVVDFFPDKLEDFAIPKKHNIDTNSLDSDEDIASQKSYGSNDSESEGQHWEWYFFLMVQDPDVAKLGTQSSESMLLQVAGANAEYLLNMEACDLRSDKVALHKLKEKLFVLWGDLEEKKTEHNMSGEELQKEGIAISSTAFECMIEEFGVPALTEDDTEMQDQWERMFALIKTNIS